MIEKGKNGNRNVKRVKEKERGTGETSRKTAENRDFYQNFQLCGLLYPHPLTDPGQTSYAWVDPQSALTRRISSPYGSLCRPWVAKNSKFYRFLMLSFCRGFAQRCRDKAGRGWTSANNSPIQRYQDGFRIPTPSWWSGCHKLGHSEAWRTNKKTNERRITRDNKTRGQPLWLIS